MPSRRKFITNASLASPLLLPGIEIKRSGPTHPAPPEFPKSELRRHGWVKDGRGKIEKEGAMWSYKSYNWRWLRNRVRDKTSGEIDIPLGKIVAYRIGNNNESMKIGDRKITDGRDFLITRKASRGLSDDIEDDFRSRTNHFSKIGFSTLGKLEWKYDPYFPASASVIMDKCDAEGSLTTENSGSVYMTQFNLKYPMRSDTVNVNQSVKLEQDEELEFFGWLAGWGNEERIMAVGAVHPKSMDEYCGLGGSHIEKVLSDILGREIDLDLEDVLHGKVHNLMATLE